MLGGGGELALSPLLNCAIYLSSSFCQKYVIISSFCNTHRTQKKEWKYFGNTEPLIYRIFYHAWWVNIVIKIIKHLIFVWPIIKGFLDSMLIEKYWRMYCSFKSDYFEFINPPRLNSFIWVLFRFSWCQFSKQLLFAYNCFIEIKLLEFFL